MYCCCAYVCLIVNIVWIGLCQLRLKFVTRFCSVVFISFLLLFCFFRMCFVFHTEDMRLNTQRLFRLFRCSISIVLYLFCVRLDPVLMLRQTIFRNIFIRFHLCLPNNLLNTWYACMTLKRIVEDSIQDILNFIFQVRKQTKKDKYGKHVENGRSRYDCDASICFIKMFDSLVIQFSVVFFFFLQSKCVWLWCNDNCISPASISLAGKHLHDHLDQLAFEMCNRVTFKIV